MGAPRPLQLNWPQSAFCGAFGEQAVELSDSTKEKLTEFFFQQVPNLKQGLDGPIQITASKYHRPEPLKTLPALPKPVVVEPNGNFWVLNLAEKGTGRSRAPSLGINPVTGEKVVDLVVSEDEFDFHRKYQGQSWLPKTLVELHGSLDAHTILQEEFPYSVGIFCEFENKFDDILDSLILIAEATKGFWENRLAHGDLHEQNVLINSERACLIDFETVVSQDSVNYNATLEKDLSDFTKLLHYTGFNGTAKLCDWITSLPTEKRRIQKLYTGQRIGERALTLPDLTRLKDRVVRKQKEASDSEVIVITGIWLNVILPLRHEETSLEERLKIALDVPERIRMLRHYKTKLDQLQASRS